MDIEYLLFLQDLRETAPQWISVFLTFMSELAVSFFRMGLPAVIFWCISKQGGGFMLFAGTCANTVNGAVKNTACVYRPWIRDSRVHSSLMATATGYSFPSGHTTCAVSIYGGVGMLLRKHGKWVLPVLLIPAVITGFARNWVGAHTPQDVVCGFVFSFAVLLLSAKIFAWLDANPDKDLLFAGIGVTVGILVLVYVSLKPYPLDYNPDGTLLVDPNKMMNDCFKDTGRLIGFLIGWILERRFIQFDIGGTTARRIARGAVGLATTWLIYRFLKAPLTGLMGANPGGCAYNILLYIYISAGFPLLIKLAEKERAGRRKRDRI